MGLKNMDYAKELMERMDLDATARLKRMTKVNLSRYAIAVGGGIVGVFMLPSKDISSIS